MNYTVLLTEIGLSPAQAEIYEILVVNGEKAAGRIARLSTFGRGMVYVTLEQLIKLGFVEKRERPGKPDVFVAHHPSELEALVEKKRTAASTAHASFETVIHQLKSAYESKQGQPGIRFYTGAEGLLKVYKEINILRPPHIYLIRASTYSETSEMADLIRAQVARQTELGIAARVITPLHGHMLHSLELDAHYKNTERRIIPREVFETPAQIIIYGDKVAISTYHEPVLTTIIEHTDITRTLLTMFEYIWRASARETSEIVQRLQGEREQKK